MDIREDQSQYVLDESERIDVPTRMVQHHEFSKREIMGIGSNVDSSNQAVAFNVNVRSKKLSQDPGELT